MTEPIFGAFKTTEGYNETINTPSQHPEYYKFHQSIVDEAKARLPNSDEKVTVLNVACGPSNEFKFLENDPKLRLIGLDIDPTLIKNAKNTYGKNADFVIGDTRHSPIAENSIDAAFAVNAVIYNPDAVLDMLYKALKKGAKCAINFRVYGNKFNEPFYKSHVENGSVLEDEELDVKGEKFNLKIVNYANNKKTPFLGRQVYFTSEADIKRFIKTKGFIIDKEDKFHFKSPNNPDNEIEVYTLQKP